MDTREQTTTVTTVVDAYLAAYGEPDPDVRAVRLEAAFTADCRLIDPPAVGEGRAGVSGLADALQGQFPGHTFRRSTAVDAHHDHVRYGWELLGPDGAVVLRGMDVAALAPDGRLEQVVGFFGDLVPAGGDR
jgi:SnoaL-like domain